MLNISNDEQTNVLIIKVWWNIIEVICLGKAFRVKTLLISKVNSFLCRPRTSRISSTADSARRPHVQENVTKNTNAAFLGCGCTQQRTFDTPHGFAAFSPFSRQGPSGTRRLSTRRPPTCISPPSMESSALTCHSFSRRRLPLGCFWKTWGSRTSSAWSCVVSVWEALRGTCYFAVSSWAVLCVKHPLPLSSAPPRLVHFQPSGL